MMPATTANKQLKSYTSARVISDALKDRLTPFCQPDRCVIAGAIRRKEAYVGDIDLVCIPRSGKATPPGEMFETECNLVINHLTTHAAFADSCRGYNIMKGGPRYYQILFAGMSCDIFMTTPRQWGRMLTLRTGPAEYSKSMAARWVQMGYHGVNGRLVGEFDGELHTPCFFIEENFFGFLKWKYIKPEQRG